MKKFLAHPASFVVLYLLFMIPTYILPFLGSNSAVLNGVAAAVDRGMNPAMWAHLLCFGLLIAITFVRGSAISRTWLLVFPVIAKAFDFAPVLNLIPFVATVMHLLAIILGVTVSQTQPAPNAVPS